MVAILSRGVQTHGDTLTVTYGACGHADLSYLAVEPMSCCTDESPAAAALLDLGTCHDACIQSYHVIHSAYAIKRADTHVSHGLMPGYRDWLL
jgi:hypothetical protein